MSMLTITLPTIEFPLFALTAILGTVGLAWAIRGVETKHRWIVVALLGVGVSVVVWRLCLPLLDSIAAQSATSSFRLGEFFSFLLMVWFVLGPLSIGVFHAVKLVRDGVRSPNKSLERTREG
jgi:hypothetical protein